MLNMLAKTIISFSLLFIWYTYFGYPALLYISSKIKTKRVGGGRLNQYPRISILIAARNEALSIRPRIQDLLAQSYPQEKTEIIIISDGSDDETEQIVFDLSNRINNPPVRLISLKERKGKANALNKGICAANGEIIVFADARQKFDVNAIEQMVANFSDPEVGCVSGELLFVRDTDSCIQEEMGVYWALEKKIRKLESSIGSVVGATGAIYAIRKSLYRQLPSETLIDDVLTPMNVVLQGYRTIFESKARAYDIISQNVQQEWKRKVRTLAGNWQLLSIAPELFSPIENPIWLRFISHKFFRLLVPFFLPVMLLSSFLAEGKIYKVLLLCQLVGYLMAICGWLIPKARIVRVINLSFFFMTLNIAVVYGFFYWITGNCSKTWGKG